MYSSQQKKQSIIQGKCKEESQSFKKTAWWFSLFVQIQEVSNGVVLFLPIDGRYPKKINENYNCHCPSVKINMGMDLDVINPFSAMAGTILYFKQHEVNQNLGVWKWSGSLCIAKDQFYWEKFFYLLMFDKS